MRRVAIYGSITDSLVASILQYMSEEARDKVVQEQGRIMHKSSHKAIAFGNSSGVRPSVDLQGCDFRAAAAAAAAAGWAYC